MALDDRIVDAMHCSRCGNMLVKERAGTWQYWRCTGYPLRYTECHYCHELLVECSCGTYGCNGEIDHIEKCEQEYLAETIRDCRGWDK